MRLVLQRFAEIDGATFGRLTGPGLDLMIAEPPWRGGGEGSCVPPGFYSLVRHDGPRYRDTWALVGEHVSHDPEPGISRSACVWHAGNWGADTEGCPLPGLELRPMLDQRRGVVELGVTDSRDAMDLLRAALRSEGPHYLTIRGTPRENALLF